MIPKRMAFGPNRLTIMNRLRGSGDPLEIPLMRKTEGFGAAVSVIVERLNE